MSRNNQIFPDDTWYQQVSAEKHLDTHCPYAADFLCPLYFESNRIADEKMIREPRINDEAQKHWKHSYLWVELQRHEPRIDGLWAIPVIKHLCPEVVSRHYHLYASTLIHYTQQPDKECIQGPSKVTDWVVITPLHFSDCPFYPLVKNISQDLSVSNESFIEEETDANSRNLDDVFRQSQNFRIINFKGKEYHLTPHQAMVVQKCYEMYKHGDKTFTQDYILNELSDEISSNRFRDVFKNKENILKTLFRKTGKSTWEFNV